MDVDYPTTLRERLATFKGCERTMPFSAITAARMGYYYHSEQQALYCSTCRQQYKTNLYHGLEPCNHEEHKYGATAQPMDVLEGYMSMSSTPRRNEIHLNSNSFDEVDAGTSASDASEESPVIVSVANDYSCETILSMDTAAMQNNGGATRIVNSKQINSDVVHSQQQAHTSRDVDMSATVIPLHSKTNKPYIKKGVRLRKEQTLQNCKDQDAVQLKKILDAKDELITSLTAENQRYEDQRRCSVCLNIEASTVIMPCGHFCACAGCATQLYQCPVCRGAVHNIVRAYFA